MGVVGARGVDVSISETANLLILSCGTVSEFIQNGGGKNCPINSGFVDRNTMMKEVNIQAQEGYSNHSMQV